MGTRQRDYPVDYTMVPAKGKESDITRGSIGEGQSIGQASRSETEKYHLRHWKARRSEKRGTGKGLGTVSPRL